MKIGSIDLYTWILLIQYNAYEHGKGNLGKLGENVTELSVVLHTAVGTSTNST